MWSTTGGADEDVAYLTELEVWGGTANLEG